MKVYVSGPISGKENKNIKAFEIAREKIKALGHEAIIPHDVCADMPDDLPWKDYMKRDIVALMACDRICMLEWWHVSEGARLEKLIAQAVGIPEFFID